MLVINSAIQIPLEEFEFSYSRSGGPGGQNVNKVNSKATLRWAITTSPSLPEHVRERFINTFGTRITTDGELVLASQKYRDQYRNTDDCLEKLREMLLAVATPPKKRRPTKPSKAAKERRVETKRAHSSKKQMRRRPHDD